MLCSPLESVGCRGCPCNEDSGAGGGGDGKENVVDAVEFAELDDCATFD